MLCTSCPGEKTAADFYAGNKTRCRTCQITAKKEVAQRTRVIQPDLRIHRDGLPILNSTMPSSDPYLGRELLPFDGRPGCNDALLLPSRMGDKLCYRGGRTEAMP